MKAKEWYLRQTPRDQRIVLALLVLVSLVMIYLLAIHPIKQGLDNRRVNVSAKQETLAWMQKNAQQVLQVRGSAGTAKNTDNRAAYVLLDQSIRSAGLSSAVDRVEPAGKDKKGARVQFSQVDFGKLIRMLGQLQTDSGLSVSSANINRKNGGLVSARITVESGG